MITQVVAKLALIPATQRVERPLNFAESEADQLCILAVYLKRYILFRMPLCFGSNHVEEAFAFHNLCLSGGDAPLSFYATYFHATFMIFTTSKIFWNILK